MPTQQLEQKTASSLQYSLLGHMRRLSSTFSWQRLANVGVNLFVICSYFVIGALYYRLNEYKPVACESNRTASLNSSTPVFTREELGPIVDTMARELEAGAKVSDALELAGRKLGIVCQESWTVVDSVYFVVVTMSTVGYGDLTPSSDGSRAFTSAWILLGMGFVWYRISQFFSAIYETLEDEALRTQTALLKGLLARHMPSLFLPGSPRPAAQAPQEEHPPEPQLRHTRRTRIRRIQHAEDMLESEPPLEPPLDLDGDGVLDVRVPPSGIVFYTIGLQFMLQVFCCLLLISMFIYAWIEPLSYSEAIYLSWITATTVGYGDVPISTQSGRIWATVQIMISVSWINAVISRVSFLQEKRTIQLRQFDLLLKQLDMDLILSLDRDHNGVNELEFVTGMLCKLGIVTESDIAPFRRQFRFLDRSGNGILDQEDLKRMVSTVGKKVRIDSDVPRYIKLLKYFRIGTESTRENDMRNKMSEYQVTRRSSLNQHRPPSFRNMADRLKWLKRMRSHTKVRPLEPQLADTRRDGHSSSRRSSPHVRSTLSRVTEEASDARSAR